MAPIGYEIPGMRRDAEIWRIFSQRKFMCISCAMLLLPFMFILFSSDYYMKSGEPLTSSQPDVTNLIDFSVGGCNIWKGDWIPHKAKPAYTNESCSFIQDHQNCMKNGRPDQGFLHWRWKPRDCDLALFDAKSYLRLVTGKSWAFIGDSISRNHFQSFLCSLAQVEYPKNLYKDDMDRFVHWYFPSYNFTLAVLWSPFLVEGTEGESEGFAKGIEKLHLDMVDKNWASDIHKYDYIVLSSGQWFLKSSVYFVHKRPVGCHYCQGLNVKEVGFYYAYRMALRTVFDFLLSSDYKGVVFFRTFTPDHFENGRWDNGGNCVRKVPFKNNEISLQGMTAEMYKIQLQEFGKTLLNRSDFTFQLQLADTIHASLLRPDAHPGPYRQYQPFANVKKAQVQNDCLHWCLPGAVDTWSAMLLEMLRHV